MSTIASISTAPGIGGIGIIRMSGEKTFEILDKIFDVTCVSNGLTSCNVKLKLLGGNLDILYNDNNHVYDWPC